MCSHFAQFVQKFQVQMQMQFQKLNRRFHSPLDGTAAKDWLLLELAIILQAYIFTHSSSRERRGNVRPSVYRNDHSTVTADVQNRDINKHYESKFSIPKTLKSVLRK